MYGTYGSRPAEPEGEDRFFNEVLCDHVLEGRDDAIDADLWEAHTQNTIELGCYESDTRLVYSFAESLSFHFQAFIIIIALI